jgi:tetratricopeptide (TPR) repeat protein
MHRLWIVLTVLLMLAGVLPAAAQTSADAFVEATALYMAEREGEALALINDALAADPRCADCLALRAVLYLRADRLNSAENDIEAAFALEKDNWYALLSRAYLRNRQDRNAEALDDAERAQTLRPDSASPYYMAGVIYMGMRQGEDAVAAFNEGLTRAFDFYTELWLLADRGQAYRQLGLYEEAIDSISAAIALDPTDSFEDSSSYYLRASIYADDLQAYNLARPDVERSIATAAPDTWSLTYAYRLLGILELQESAHKAAMQAFTDAISAAQRREAESAVYIDNYILRAFAAFSIGDCAAAAADYAVFVEAGGNPDYIPGFGDSIAECGPGVPIPRPGDQVA